MTTEERLAKVERELGCAKRRSRWLLVVVGLTAGVFALIWVIAPGRATVIRANAFILVDKNDKTRAELDMFMDVPSLTLWDENGRIRATLNVNEDGPALTLFDENGRTRAALSVNDNLDGPALAFSDEKGKIRAALTLFKDGPGFYGWYCAPR